jgi:hypothetical protein
MITFPCNKCGYAFEVPLDLAGSAIQCPQCNVLADVPTLDDLPNLNPDGTFGFESANSSTETVTAGELHRAFTRQTTDSRGREKDLRMHAEDLRNVGVDEGPMRVAPRYDPVTGELITPLALKDETPIPVLSIATEVDPATVDHLDYVAVPTPVLPLPAPGPVKSLSYAAGESRRVVTMATLAIELLMPANLVVMLFVLLGYTAGHYTTIGLSLFAGLFFKHAPGFLLLNLPMWFLIAHVGCVLEEIGPDAFDELPRPLRNFSIGEDLWFPAIRVMLAMLICFAPLCVLLQLLDPANPVTPAIDIVFGATGIFLFPAVLLTTVTGTTILNLQPDRVGSVIRLAGLQYFASVMLFLLAAVPSVYYVGNELLFPGKLSAPLFAALDRPGPMLAILAGTVYVLHFFTWHLALIYRNHHDDFPWLAQRHVKALRA